MKKLFINIVTVCIVVFSSTLFFSSCTQNGISVNLKTKEDSLAFAKSIYQKYNEVEMSGSKTILPHFALSQSRQISADTAKFMFNNYFESCINAGEDSAKILKCLMVDKAALDSIFSNPAATTLRMYLGKHGKPSSGGLRLDNDYTLMLMGVTDQDVNITDNIWDNCTPCPSMCPAKDF